MNPARPDHGTVLPDVPELAFDRGWAQHRAAAEDIPDLLHDLATLLDERPPPLRAYDQIHMRIEDLAAHILMIAPLLEGKRVFFMGDSDGMVLGLAYAAGRGLVPKPGTLILGDFDKRVLHFVKRMSKRLGLEATLETQLYNVFEPLPLELDASVDFFHTNPPYGQYNGGRSVLAFVDRALAATKRGGGGLIILANDSRYPWSHDVLRAVLDALVDRDLTPFRVLDECHRYHLDDQPDLRSGIALCADVNPEKAFSPADPLPEFFVERFYGRVTVQIPKFIPLEDEGQLELLP